MLVILSESDKESGKSDRSTSGKLKADFQRWAAKCDEDADYCIEGKPTPRRPARVPTAVLAPLNEEAESHIKLNKSQLDLLQPGRKTKSSVLWENLPKEG